MATEVKPGDVLLARLEYKVGTDRAFNVLHYKVNNITDNLSGLPAAVELPFFQHGSNLAAGVFNKISPVWDDAASSGVSMVGAMCQNIYPAPNSAQYFYTPVPVVGTIASEALPLQDAPTILKRTIMGTRWGLGRLFAVGTPENGQNAGVMTVGQVALWNDVADVLDDTFDVVSGDYTFQLQPILYGPNPAGGFRIVPIVKCELSDNVLKSQRRRRPGKGI